MGRYCRFWLASPPRPARSVSRARLAGYGKRRLLRCCAAPNFAFRLASQQDQRRGHGGLDLGGVRRAATAASGICGQLKLIDRFTPFNLDPKATRPSYEWQRQCVATRKQVNRQNEQFDRLPDGQAETDQRRRHTAGQLRHHRHPAGALVGGPPASAPRPESDR